MVFAFTNRCEYFPYGCFIIGFSFCKDAVIQLTHNLLVHFLPIQSSFLISYLCTYSSSVFTCEHLVHSRCHIHLCQALPGLSVVQFDLCTALQRQPHTLTIRHHARHTPTAVSAHLEPVLWGRRTREVQRRCFILYESICVLLITIYIFTLSARSYLLYQCSCVDNKDSVLWATPKLPSHRNHFGDRTSGRAQN